MHMQAMNNFGNQRGYGGPPQPQRQGGRRGSHPNRGGFRNNSRFDQPPNQQRSQSQQGQRTPNESNLKKKPEESPQQQPSQQQPIQQQSTQQQPPQQQQPSQQQKPQQQVQQQKPQQPQAQQQKSQQPSAQAQQPKPDTPAQPSAPKQATPVKKDVTDNANQVAKPEQTNVNQNQQPQNVNGNFVPKQGGWQMGGGGNYGQGNQGNRQSFSNFGQGKQFGQRQGGPGNQNNQGGSVGQGNQAGSGGQGGPGGPGRQSGPGSQGGPGGQGRQGGPGGSGGPIRNQRRSMRGPPDGKQPQREDIMLINKLKELAGPLHDLPSIDQDEVKFNGRSRLYIGNLTSDITEEDLQAMFTPFGECAELFLNKEKNFAFIKMDYRANAEKAKRELDGKIRNSRPLKVRFAPHNSAIRVKNLPIFVSNELLYRAFEIFGKIEKAYVKVDERGKPLSEGVVEFSRKPSALAAIRNCSEKCFFLTSSLRPVIVESLEEPEEIDGYPEKNLPKKHPDFMKAREVGPRFSEPSSFEHEYGSRWKQLHELYRQKEEALKKELAAEEEKLEAQMEYARYEHETEMLREQLRQREQDRERQKRSWEMAERAAEERREADRVALLQQEEQLTQRMRVNDDELRRRQQENTLFVQAQRLNSILDRQEQSMFDQQQPMDGGYRDQFEMGRSYDDMPQNRVWDAPRQMDDFPNKRRRY